MKLLPAILLALCTTSHAQSFFQMEAGVGVTHYQTENGRWYQNGMPDNKVTSTAPAISLGVTGPVVSRGAWGVDWHADYVNLGRAAASCQCDTNDADYIAHTTKHTAFYSGSGRAQGVALTVGPYRYYAGLRWGVEAGAYVYHSSWSESVAGWTVGGPPVNLSLSESRWNVAPVAGLSVGDGKWAVSYRHYFMRYRKAEMVPPLWNDADVLMFTRRF
jgi:hypothetical protein